MTSGTLQKQLRTNVWYIVAALFILVLGVVALAPWRSYAAAKGLYITPDRPTTQVGKTFSVTVRLAPGQKADGVQATLTYDPTCLKYVSVDTSGSGFPIDLPLSTTGNSVTISRGIFGPNVVKSNVVVAKVSFKALVKTSSTNIGLTGNATYQGAYINPSTVGAAVRIK